MVLVHVGKYTSPMDPMRMAMWKAFRHLQALGYDILSSPFLSYNELTNNKCMFFFPQVPR